MLRMYCKVPPCVESPHLLFEKKLPSVRSVEHLRCQRITRDMRVLPVFVYFQHLRQAKNLRDTPMWKQAYKKELRKLHENLLQRNAWEIEIGGFCGLGWGATRVNNCTELYVII